MWRAFIPEHFRLLPTLGSKAKYVRGNTAVGTSCTGSISGFCTTASDTITADTFGLALIRGSLLLLLVGTSCSASSISGFCTAGTRAPVYNISIASVGNVRTACGSTRSTEISLICPIYFEYRVRFDHPCTMSTILKPNVRHKTLPDNATSGSWSKLLSLGTTRVLKSTGSISSYAQPVLSVSRGSVLRVFCLYSKYFVFRYCGYILACALCVRYCSYSRYSEYLGLLSTRNILAASAPILSVLGLRFVLEHLFVKPLYY